MLETGLSRLALLRRRSYAVLAVCCGLCACGEPKQPAAVKKSPVAAPAAKITIFYASPATIGLGQETLLCYGVEDASWVKLDPPVETLTPSMSRCFTVKPRVTTRYRLSVPGQTKEVEVRVGPAVAKKSEGKAATLIQFFGSDKQEVPRGGKVTLCYGVLKTKSVKLDPGGRSLPLSERSCFEEQVSQTTVFKLQATGVDGSQDAMAVTVKTP